MSAIEVSNLVKRYRDIVAVDGISLSVDEGEIFGICGPNGAGKTTLVECMEGLRRPDAGKVTVLGADPVHAGAQLRRRVGVQLQSSLLPDQIRVWEALDLFASYYRRPVDWRGLLEEWGLAAKRHAAFADLSGGQQQRLFIALALLNDPAVVFFDELTTGLDPRARRNTWALVRQIQRRGVTIVLVTHDLAEAQQLCDRVAIVNRGRIVALDRPAALVQQTVTEREGTLEEAFLSQGLGTDNVVGWPESHVDSPNSDLGEYAPPSRSSGLDRAQRPPPATRSNYDNTHFIPTQALGGWWSPRWSPR